MATAVWAGLLVWSFLDLYAKEPEGPEFKYDPDKALVFKPNPTQASVPLYTSLRSDGKMRAEAGYRNVRVFSVPDNTLLYEFATPNQAMAAAFSPDLKTIAFVDSDNLSSGSIIYTRELETGKQSKIGSCLGSIMWLTFSGDGKRLAGVSIYGPIPGVLAKERFKRDLGGEVTVFDVSTQNDLLTMAYILPERPTAKNGDKVAPYLPTHIALDHDGSTLLLASTSGMIKVINVETGDNRISIELDLSAKPKE
jgi:WD40 repeat protein